MKYCFLRFPEGKYKADTLDYDTVYNPTLYKIWLYVDSGVTCVESGETKKLA